MIHRVKRVNCIFCVIRGVFNSCDYSALCVFSPVTSDQSVGGSYLGREPMGLFWSLQPAPGGRDGLRQVTISGSPRDSPVSLNNSITTTFDTKCETRTRKLQQLGEGYDLLYMFLLRHQEEVLGLIRSIFPIISY